MKNLKRVVLREEYVAISDGVIGALILNQMIYWSERIRDFDKFIGEEKDRAKNEGRDVNLDFINGWIYKSYDEIKQEIMVSDSIKIVTLIEKYHNYFKQ